MNAKQLRESLNTQSNVLKELLAVKKKSLGKKAKDNPEVQKLELLIKASAQADTKTILKKAFADIKQKRLNRTPQKGRQSLQEKIDDAYEDWILLSKELEYDPNGPIERYSTPKGRQARIDELKSHLVKETKDWLLHELCYAATTIEEMHQKIEAQSNELSFLSDKFESFHSGRKKTVEKQGKGKEQRFKSDNDCLKAAFDKFKRNLGRPILAEDFTLYFVILEHYFPVPPAPENSEASSGEWAMKTVRNYFEKQTNLKSSYSKKKASELSREHFSDNR
jgi:hypothetical protein